MDFHPLNMAHHQHRRAEAHLKHKRFDESIECHHKAAELLMDALKYASSSVALESITLQHKYHLKQKDLIEHKKEQYARVKKAIKNLKQLGKEVNPFCEPNTEIQVAIYKTLNDTNFLLNTLSTSKEQQDNLDKISLLDKKTSPDEKVKEQKTIIEEVLCLNRNLQSQVEKLVIQVELLKDENITVNDRVKYLEKEREKYLTIQSSDLMLQNNFSNLSLFSSEGFGIGPHPPAVVAQSKIYDTGVVRPIQQPHFDLSAFTDE